MHNDGPQALHSHQVFSFWDLNSLDNALAPRTTIAAFLLSVHQVHPLWQNKAILTLYVIARILTFRLLPRII